MARGHQDPDTETAQRESVGQRHDHLIGSHRGLITRQWQLPSVWLRPDQGSSSAAQGRQGQLSVGKGQGEASAGPQSQRAAERCGG